MKKLSNTEVELKKNVTYKKTFIREATVRRCSSTHVLESLFNKVAGLTPTQLFSCEYFEIFKNSVFIEHLRWLLLLFALYKE